MKKKPIETRTSSSANQSGITLIALIITIIVMLILAGITMSVLFGEDGLINKAREASRITEEKAKEEEGILDSYLNLIKEHNGEKPSAEESVQIIKTRWKNSLAPSEEMMSLGSEMANIRNSLRNNATTLWNSMNKSDGKVTLWGNQALNATTAGSSAKTTQYTNLTALAKAYVAAAEPTDGSASLKGNQELLEDIIYGLDWMYEYGYVEGVVTNASNIYGHEIGAPTYLVHTLMLIENKLTKEQIQKYLSPIEWYVPSPLKMYGRDPKVDYYSTGSNRSELCYMYLGYGALLNDTSKIETAVTGIAEENGKILTYTKRTDAVSDGFYKDGSNIMHSRFPYNGSYGLILVKSISQMSMIINGTNFDFAPESLARIYEIIDTGILPIMYNGGIMYAFTGRGISSYNVSELRHGPYLVEALVNFSIYAQEPFKTRYQGIAKYMMSKADNHRYPYISDPNCIYEANRIKNDSSIGSTFDLRGNFVMANADRTINRGNNFGFTISMYSNRTAAYEGDTNDQNIQGWHTADGMTYLYNSDTSYYGVYSGGHYLATIDRKRLPGTTIDTKFLEDRAGGARGYRSPQNFVGGASLGGYGTTAMYLDKRRADGTVDSDIGYQWVENVRGDKLPHLYMDLEAKKSWFVFDNEIVCLGTGIKSGHVTGLNPEIETIVDNRRLKTDGSNLCTVNGTAITSNPVINDAKWAHVTGNITGSDVGYYFPSTQEVNTLKERRSGSWSELNKGNSTTPLYDWYFTMWFEHGVNPTNETYDYVILPSMNSVNTQNYSNNPDIEIRKNDTNVQAVYEKTTNTLGIVFWEDGQTIETVSTNKKCIVMLKKDGNNIELSVSDPTMLESTIEITLNESISSIISKDSTISTQKDGGTYKIIVNVSGSEGATHNIKLNRY